jgi:hypothetical protein
MGRAHQTVKLLGGRGKGAQQANITVLVLERAVNQLAGEADGKADKSQLVTP